MMIEESGPTVGVVTVAYRSNDVLAGFLGSLPAASVRAVATVVVDNWQGEGSAARSLAEAANAIYLAMPNNAGYGAAMNAGIAALPPTVDWVLIANPDVTFLEGSIDTLVTAGQSSDDIGAVGPAVLNSDGTLYPSARAVPSLRTGIGHALFVNLWQTNPWTRRYRQDSATSGDRRDAGWLSGACVLVRRSAFASIGGFDERFFMYFEDVDLGYRLGTSGWRNLYEPAATVIHSGAHSTSAESALMVRAHHASARRFLSKKYAGWWLWPVRAVLNAGLALRSSVARHHSGEGD